MTLMPGECSPPRTECRNLPIRLTAAQTRWASKRQQEDCAMKSSVIAGVAAGLIAFLAGSGFVRSASAQAPACRRGSEQTKPEIERRAVAIQLVRTINGAQAS